MLGRAVIYVGDRRVEPSAEMVFAALLMLALERGKGFSRQQMAEMLWPDAPYATRAGRLRWLLSKLRSMDVLIDTRSTTAALETKDVEWDVDDLGTSELTPQMAILSGYAPAFSRLFESWLGEWRTRLTAQAIQLLSQRLERAINRRPWPETRAVADAVLSLDPLHEPAILACAEALVRVSARKRAISQLEDYLSEIRERSPHAGLRVAVYLNQIKNETSSSKDQTPFVGRSEHLRHVDSMLTELGRGKGGAIAFSGPAGIGKTRLLEEARNRAIAANIVVVSIRCQRSDVDRPLAGVIDLLTQLLELPGALGCEPANLTFLRKLTQPEVSQPEPAFDVSSSNPVDRRIQIAAALSDLLGSIALEAPLLVQVEDIHWANPSAGWLWEQVTDASAELAIGWMFSLRPVLEKLPIGELPVIPIGPLDEAASRELVEQTASSSHRGLDHAAAEAITSRSAGSPLFIRELSRQWKVGNSADMLPPSLNILIELALTKLTRHALRILQSAALLGTYATVERIQKVSGLTQSELIEALLELDAAGILTTDGIGAMHGHVLWADASLARLPSSVKIILHTYAARAFHEEHAERSDCLLLWQSVQHWLDAGQTEQARAAIVSGATHLYRAGFLRDAAVAFARAAGLTGDTREHLMLLRLQVDSMWRAGMWTDTLAEIDKYRELACKVDPSYSGHDDLEIVRFDMKLADFDRATELLSATLDCVRTNRATREHRLAAARTATKIATFVCPDALHELNDFALHYEPSSPAENWDRLRIRLMFEERVGSMVIACELAAELLAEARKADDVHGVERALNIYARSLAFAGRLDDARSAWSQAFDLARRTVLTHAMGSGLDNMLAVSIDVDAPEDTRALLESAKPTWQTLGAYGARLFIDLTMRHHEAAQFVREARFDDALRTIPSIEMCLSIPVTRFRAQALATHLGSRLGLAHHSGIGDIASALSNSFDSSDYWLDRPAAFFASYLQQFGAPGEAEAFAKRFISTIRRELYPPPAELIALAANAPATV